MRKFAHGDTKRPHDATLQKLGAAYLAFQGTQGVAEKLAPVEPPDPAEMRLAFPNRDAAYRLVNRVHEVFREHAGADDEELSQSELLRSMMRRMADAGFATEAPTYEELHEEAKRKKAGGGAKSPSHSPRKSKEASGDAPAPPKKRHRKRPPGNEDGG